MASRRSLGILERHGSRSVLSSLGFEVHEAFPRELEYREGDHVLRFSAAADREGESSVILFEGRGTDHWQAPHAREQVSDAKKHQVLVRVTAALTLLGIPVTWESLSSRGPRDDWPAIRAEAAALLRRAK